MSGFLDRFRGEHTGWAKGRSVWTTLTPLRYQSDRVGSTIVVPAEFITDLASVPRLPLVWLATGGRGPRSAVVHDWAYQWGMWTLENGATLSVTRALADAVFHESLLADPISGAGRARAWEMWLGVRVGGRGVWAERPERTPALNPIWAAERPPESP